MQVSLLHQGLPKCKESVDSVLLESLQDTAFESFNCLSAFASVKGLSGIKDAITKSKGHIKNFNVTVGIDQNGTSKEALETLLDLDIEARIYYAINSSIIFHPKVYLFDGKEKTRIIIGSSNLTLRGLFRNFEASFKIDFSKPDEQGDRLLQETQEYLNYFFDSQTLNSQKLTPELIQKLTEKQIIPTDAERKKRKEQRKTIQVSNKYETTIDEISQLFPTVELQSLPEGLKFSYPKKPQTTVTTELEEPSILTTAKKPLRVPLAQTPLLQDPWTLKGKLLWRKENLPKSDILQSGRKGTNVTGCLRLVQAKNLGTDGKLIDHTTYFRKNIFSKLNWKQIKAKPYEEGVEATFYIKIDGKDFGLQHLRLMYKPSGEAKQRNQTTSISWGDFGKEISRKDLTGKTLYLYASANKQNDPFYIEIKDKENPLKKFFG